MIKFFRHIRKKFISKNRFSKYLIYAIGEIILVVIGIMIALQVNNWNQEKNKDKKTKAIFNQVLSDLVLEVKTLKEVNKFFLRKDSLIRNYQKTDFKTLKKDTNVSYLLDLIRTFYTSDIDNKSYNLLINHTDQLDTNYKEYIDELMVLYQDLRNVITGYNKGLKEMLKEHRRYKINNKNWYSNNFTNNQKINELQYDYYKYDPIYKNYVSYYREMLINITLPSRAFVDRANKFCKKLNTDFGFNRNIDKEISYLYPPKNLLDKISGNYLDRNNRKVVLEVKNGELYKTIYHSSKEELPSAYTLLFFDNGKLRYLGNNTFYYNASTNLKVNEDASLSIVPLFNDTITVLTPVKDD